MPERRLIRVLCCMEEVPYTSVGEYVGKQIWFSSSSDGMAAHGPYTVVDGTGGLELRPAQPTLSPVKVKDIYLSHFWVPVNE